MSIKSKLEELAKADIDDLAAEMDMSDDALAWVAKASGLEPGSEVEIREPRLSAFSKLRDSTGYLGDEEFVRERPLRCVAFCPRWAGRGGDEDGLEDIELATGFISRRYYGDPRVLLTVYTADEEEIEIRLTTKQAEELEKRLGSLRKRI
jgi:hypothetical protein